LIVINSIARVVGEAHLLQSVASVPKRIMSFLTSDGFQSYSRSSNDIVEMAASAIAASLQKSRLEPHDIDAVLLSTESWWDVEDQSAGLPKVPVNIRLREGFLHETCLTLGLSRATPYGNWLSGCANFTSTLALARGLVASGQHKNIMVVLSDRASPKATRVTESGMTVFSDGAVAFIVQKGEIGFEVEDIVFHHDPALLQVHNGKNTLLHGKAMQQAANGLGAKLRAAGRAAHSHYKMLIADNMHAMSLSFVSSGLGITRDRLETPLKPFGHFFSADCLLGLLHFEEAAKLDRDDSIGLVNVGPAGVGLSSLRYLQ